MYRIKGLVAVLVILLHLTNAAMAQNSISSPYTRFGFGELNSMSLAAGRSMGGVGVGMRNKGMINPLNPASFTNIDTLSFAFEVGGSARMSKIRSGENSQTDFNGNFDYVVGQFPLCKWAGMSFGLLPYSAVGYDYAITREMPAGSDLNPTSKDYTFQQSYNGTGGVNQIFLGVAFKPYKYFSVGANLYYQFGNINHYRESVLTSEAGYTASQSSDLHIKDVRLRYGLQVMLPMHEDSELTIGTIYENRTKVNGDYRFISTLSSVTADTVNTSYGFEFPETFGVGASYVFDKKLTVAFDYTMQRWSGARYYGVRDSLKNESRYSFGAEYQPDRYGKKYYTRMKYRIGASFSDSYVKTSENMNKYTLTLGFGLPVRRNTSYLNLGLEYGHFGSRASEVMKEEYLKLSLSVTLVERWFLKSVIR